MTPEQLDDLLNRKFGKKHGRNARAADAIGVHRSNFSSALNSGKFPDKYIDAIVALPDQHKPIGMSVDFCPEVSQLTYHFTTELTPDARQLLDFMTRCATQDHTAPDLSANPEITAKWFENILRELRTMIYKFQPELAAKVDAAIEVDRIAEREEFNRELKNRKHLVADELTENENDDDDPLS